MTPDFCTPDEDITKGCQSNCEQPGSGKSGGNVQDRIIGYYEAWAHDRSCTGMDFRDIPVGSLTHLYFSFGYISPGSFEIAPMDGLPFELFTKMTDMKKFNPGLKCVVALGGWTFNDPGPTQFVFSNMVSTPANRKKAIINLLSFMRQYAFDGVDFDWVSLKKLSKPLVQGRRPDNHVFLVCRNTPAQMIEEEFPPMGSTLPNSSRSSTRLSPRNPKTTLYHTLSQQVTGT